MTNSCHETKDLYSVIYKSSVLLPIAGGVSIFFYSLIFYSYFIARLPPLRRHPTCKLTNSISQSCCCSDWAHLTFFHWCSAIVVRRCVWEAVYIVQFLWVPVMDAEYFYSDLGDCLASRPAAIWSFVSQVCRMAANLQLLVLAVDMHRSSANPFESYQRSEKYYQGFVTCVALISGLILLGLGNSVYGLDSNKTCWIQVRSLLRFNILVCELRWAASGYARVG